MRSGDLRWMRASACVRAALAGLLILQWQGAAAQVEGDLLHPIGKYDELYVGNPKVSGSLLVGLRWGGETPGLFDPQGVAMRVPPALPAEHSCVDIASKDGRYTAENLYGLGPSGRLAWFSAPTGHADVLHGYKVDDVGVLIRAARSCDDDQSLGIVPAVVTPWRAKPLPPDAQVLVADVNADPAFVSAALVDAKGEELASAPACSAPGTDVQIAFSSVCTLRATRKLPQSGVKLLLHVRERFEVTENAYPLLIAP